jgi:hypothetical protein
MARKAKPETQRSSDRPKTRKTGTTSSSPSGEEEYKVGPGRPPKEHQWKKGQSGNPKGAKRKKPPIVPEFKGIVVSALNKKVKMREGERERYLTRFETGVEQLTVQFAKGDKYARRDLIWLLEKLGLEFSEPSIATNETLPADRQAILDAYFERLMKEKNSSASSPIIAPPELLDDDAPDEPNER